MNEVTLPPGPPRHSQHYPLDSVAFRTRRNTSMGKGMRGVSPTEIEALLANNDTTANIETGAISASIC